MRTVVLGAGGQLGTELVAELRRRGQAVVGLSRQELDINNNRAIEQTLQDHSPAWVINSAAYNHVDLAEQEPEVAMRTNGLAVRSLAVACRKHRAVLMHFSTDHVFDGKKEAPYVEQDLPSPPSCYGVSKLAGELYAQACLDKLHIIRVAGVFGPAGRHTNRGNFPELILRKAAEGSPLKVVEDLFATPTYAPALASRSIDLLERNAFGLFHIGGGTLISWYQYALKILEASGLEADIQPINHRDFPTIARRPMHSGLSNKKIERLGLKKMPPLDKALRDYMDRRKQMKAPRTRPSTKT